MAQPKPIADGRWVIVRSEALHQVQRLCGRLQAENSLPHDIFFTRTLSEEAGEYPNVKRRYIPTLCNHCENAPCERVCPTGATYKRDGIVMVDEAKCIGCGSSSSPVRTERAPSRTRASATGWLERELTPFERQGIGRFVAGTVVKCTFCHERLDAGLQPACVITCPTDARIFGDLDDPESKARRLIEQRGGQPPLPEKNTRPKVYYID
jgi:molybdopterin-containing oxidoreductase family iron-sulfur binding subunit